MATLFSRHGGLGFNGSNLFRRSVAAATLGVMCLAGLTACDRIISGAPSGQQLVPWAQPYDRDALLAAMHNYRAADLSGYAYADLFVIQNRMKAGFAVTLEVNGQDIERRYVPAMTQEVFAVTDAVVQQTEAQTQVISANVPFLGTTAPFVVRFKNYVAEDDHLLQNTNFLLAPQNRFENNVETLTNDDGFRVNAHYVKPGAFVIVVDNTKMDVIELDREWNAVDEASDPSGGQSSSTASSSSSSTTTDPQAATDPTGTGTTTPTGTTAAATTPSETPNYLSEEIQVVQRAGLGFLLGTTPQGPPKQTTGQDGKVFVSTEEPYDHAAVKGVFPQLVATDLSGYNFSVLLILQNRLDSRFGVTLEVNGQQVERRIVDARTQEYFAITPEIIRSTELVTGVSSENISFLDDKPHPFVVRLRDYVFEDGHVSQNLNCVLSPANWFEPMVRGKSDALDPTKYLADVFYTVPSAFVISMKQDRNDIIELDRELKWQSEVDDNDETVIERSYADNAVFLVEETGVLNQLGLAWLIGGSLDPVVSPPLLPEISIEVAGGTSSIVPQQPITIYATVTPKGAPIAKVEFYDRDPAGVTTLMGTDTTVPYIITNVVNMAGKHAIWATATDTLGRTAISNAIQITTN